MMKNSTTTELIAKEGWKYLFFTGVLFVLSLVFTLLPWVFLLIFLFTIYLFRNPERLYVESDDMAILSVCDGVVTNISKDKDDNLDDCIKVEIRKSLLEVAILRSPASMDVVSNRTRHGLFLPTDTTLSKKLSQRVSLECRSGNRQLFININAGLFARKIELFKIESSLKSGQRFGLLIDGSVELYLPLDSIIKVSVGERVKAGESLLGYFAHKGNTHEK